MVGSVIVPLFAFLSMGTFFGWAKPVPYNVHNIRTKLGHAFVAAAGVLTNLLLATFTGIAFKVLALQGLLTESTGNALFLIIGVNISLAFFNLIPIPPFDGMSILQAFFPRLRLSGRIAYNPLYMVVAILVASSLYSYIVPPIMAWVVSLLG
jgi:Zn-dependent protease